MQVQARQAVAAALWLFKAGRRAVPDPVISEGSIHFVTLAPAWMEWVFGRDGWARAERKGERVTDLGFMAGVRRSDMRICGVQTTCLARVVVSECG